MSRLNSHRLFAVLVIVFIGWGQADARSKRVNQIPNGSALGCASCHVTPGGPRTLFGQEIERNYLTQPGGGGDVVWNAMLAMLDSDGDGVSNGRELGDPDGDGTVDSSIQVTNPGDPNSFVQMPPSGGAPSATSVVIGGVTISEAMMSNMMGSVVPSGMQPIEITFDQPLIVTLDPVEGIAIENVEILTFPFALLATATDLAVSEDRLKVTATLNLSADETYQMIIGGSGAMVTLNDIQQYFFGTAALPDAVVSGTAVLPQGVQISEPGVAALYKPDVLAALLASAGDDDDLFALALSAIVRVSPLSPAESFPEQLAFALQHVPDGAYALSLSQDVVDGDGNVVTMSHFSGINPFTGEVDPGTLIQVVNGASVTDLQIMLQTDPEPVDIREVSVQSVDVENNSFSVQRDGQQVSVDVSQALMITLDQKNVDDILAIFISGNVEDLAQLIFPISDLMVGDTVSFIGFPLSETTLQALMVIRHAQSQTTRSADLNGDGEVNFSDFLLFVAAFGKSEGEAGYNAGADLNSSGMIDFQDFLLFANAFGKPVSGG